MVKFFGAVHLLTTLGSGFVMLDCDGTVCNLGYNVVVEGILRSSDYLFLLGFTGILRSLYSLSGNEKNSSNPLIYGKDGFVRM